MKKNTTFLVLILICITSGLMAQTAKTKPNEPAEKKYRLLSISTTTNLILISDMENKDRLMLDASQAKVSIDGKASELKDLLKYSVAAVRIQKAPSQLHGYSIDGKALRIQVDTRK